MKYKKEFSGELIGTFILVLFGCGSVAVTVLFDAHQGLFQVAMAWGIGVTLAIYATRHLSCAHLNPAVSIAMVIGNRMTPKRLPVYIVAQFSGAFLAAATLYGIFSGSIANYEALHGLVRGAPESVQTAMIFGEFYPNPAAAPVAVVSFFNAFAAESIGTFLLVVARSINAGGNQPGPRSLAPDFRMARRLGAGRFPGWPLRIYHHLRAGADRRRCLGRALFCPVAGTADGTGHRDL